MSRLPEKETLIGGADDLAVVAVTKHLAGLEFHESETIQDIKSWLKGALVGLVDRMAVAVFIIQALCYSSKKYSQNPCWESINRFEIDYILDPTVNQNKLNSLYRLIALRVVSSVYLMTSGEAVSVVAWIF